MRTRGEGFAQMGEADHPHVVFMPKGAWIAGLPHDSSYAPGTWVRMLPGAGWPDAEPRPTLLIGRVAQRLKDAARLEILSLVSHFPTDDPNFETYPTGTVPSRSLHAITKRIAFSPDFPPDAFLEGNEIYGAYSLDDAAPDRRIASQISAILAFPPRTRTDSPQKLQILSGTLPNNPVYILLDAPLAPQYDIEIHIAAQPLQREIHNQIKSLIQNLPGSEFIRIVLEHDATDVQNALIRQGESQTDALRIDILSDILIDQGNRVTDSPYTVILEENVSPSQQALAASARAFTLLGHPASAVWILEKAWHDATNLTQRAAIAPALADAYIQMERGDWALELALSQRAHAEELSGRDRTQMLAMAATVAAQAHVAQEFAADFEDVYDHRNRLPAPWRRVFAHALIDAGSLPHARDYIIEMRKEINGWNEWDELRLCAYIPDACDTSRVQTDLGKLTLAALARDTDPASRIPLAQQADEIGAPRLAMQIWQRIAAELPADGRSAAQRAIIQYARTSPHSRRWLRSAVAAFSPNLPNAAEILSALRGFDWRAETATVCQQMAQKASPDDAIALYSLAAEMYISNGDYVHAAEALQKLAEVQESAGLSEDASKTRSRVQIFSSTN